MLESTEKIYNKIETYIIENNKVSIKRINKRSINHQVKETDRIRKTTGTLEKRATLVSKKKLLDERNNECFVDFVDVLSEKTNLAIMGRPKKRLSEQSISSRTQK